MLARGLGQTSPPISHPGLCLTTAAPLGAEIAALGIPVLALNLRRERPNPIKVLRGLAAARRFRPDIIESWLYHADLFAAAAKLTNPAARLIWNLRCSDMDLRYYNRA